MLKQAVAINVWWFGGIGGLGEICMICSSVAGDIQDVRLSVAEVLGPEANACADQNLCLESGKYFESHSRTAHA